MVYIYIYIYIYLKLFIIGEKKRPMDKTDTIAYLSACRLLLLVLSLLAVHHKWTINIQTISLHLQPPPLIYRTPCPRPWHSRQPSWIQITLSQKPKTHVSKLRAGGKGRVPGMFSCSLHSPFHHLLPMTRCSFLGPPPLTPWAPQRTPSLGPGCPLTLRQKLQSDQRSAD